MKDYTSFDSNVQCEENAQVTPEEYDEVMQLMADEYQAQEGFGTWSAAVEEKPAAVEDGKDWLNGYSNSTDGPDYNGIDI